MNTYYLTTRAKYLFSFFTLFYLIIFISLLFYASREVFCVQIVFLGFGIFNINYMLRKLNEEHIEISQNGIEYHAPGIIFATNWEEIKSITKHWHNGGRHECLVVDNSKIRMKEWSFFYGRTIPQPFELPPRYTLIPLGCFSEDWRDSELGQQIKQYAPHLFK
ncbi:MAG: hypothetical protein U0Z26_10895 [Anaerolineales bacterium]